MDECTNSSVWAHYGNEHKGVCLSFKASSFENDKAAIKLSCAHRLKSLAAPADGIITLPFHKISYEGRYVEVDFFRTLGRIPIPELMNEWYMSKNGCQSTCVDDSFVCQGKRTDKYWTNFYQAVTTKLEDWSHEKEYRLIITNEHESVPDLSDPENRKFRYDFESLEAITFGIKTPRDEKLTIMEIVEKKCQNADRKDIKFYQACYSEKDGCIERFQIADDSRLRAILQQM